MKKLLFLLVAGLLFVGCNHETPEPPVVEPPVEEPDPEPVEELVGFDRGVFYISATQAVRASRGNLQYRASRNKYRFAPNQYDVIGKKNEKLTLTYDGWVDLLGWGRGDNAAKTTSDVSIYNPFYEWGAFVEEDGWRTLTYEQWRYLIVKHTKGVATVCGVHGMIILPSNWEQPQGIGFVAEFDDDWSVNIYDKESWAAMEEAGALFLPAAGCRAEQTVNSVGEVGYYWSSTPNGLALAYTLHYFSSYSGMDVLDRSVGRCVRLFRDVEITEQTEQAE